jgi:hypothetical protein
MMLKNLESVSREKPSLSQLLVGAGDTALEFEK